MGAGFKIRNNGGFIQVDQDFRNMALRYKGAIGGWPYAETFDYRIYTIHFAAERPIMAVQLSEMYVRVWSMLSNGDGTWSISILTVGDPGNLQFYIYDVPQNIGYYGGIVVRDGAWNVVFNSAQKYMTVVSVNGFPGIPAGKTYAYVQAGQQIQKSDIAIDGTGGFNRTTRVNVYRQLGGVIGRTLYTSNVQFFDGPTVYRPPVLFGQENFIILEVSYQ